MVSLEQRPDNHKNEYVKNKENASKYPTTDNAKNIYFEYGLENFFRNLISDFDNLFNSIILDYYPNIMVTCVAQTTFNKSVTSTQQQPFLNQKRPRATSGSTNLLGNEADSCTTRSTSWIVISPNFSPKIFTNIITNRFKPYFCIFSS